MENNNLPEILANYLTGVKLNAVLPPDLMKLEPRNGFSGNPNLEVIVFNPKLDGVTNRAFELEIRHKGHFASKVSTLSGKRIKLTPSGAGASYEASINKRGFAEFKDIPPKYYSLELRS